VRFASWFEALSLKSIDHLQIGRWQMTIKTNEKNGSTFGLRIGEASQQFGITARTLRFYEQIGLLTPRWFMGSRFYNDQQVKRLQTILEAKRLGFTLQEIASFLQNHHYGEQDVATKLDLQTIESQLTFLEQKRQDLDQAILTLRLAIKCRVDEPQYKPRLRENAFVDGKKDNAEPAASRLNRKRRTIC